MQFMELVNPTHADMSNVADNVIIDSAARSTASRCLFGPADHDAVMKQLAEIQKKDSQRWNFDFEKGKPLPGKYKWTAVHNIQTVGRIPSPYKRSRAVSQSSEDSSDLPQLISPKENPVQTRITDFLRTRKTSVSCTPAKNVEEDSDSSVSSLEEDTESTPQ